MNAFGKGMLVASAVASLVLSGAVGAKAGEAKGAEAVNCAGINACKGQGSCAGAENACKAQNSCKGQGWVETRSAEECKEKGGEVVAMN